MTCNDCVNYDVCKKKGLIDWDYKCENFKDKYQNELEITREFIHDNGLEFELLSYYERKRKKH